MEVQGHATAARWVYAQALEPDDWSNRALISLHELRHIHHMAMTPVWDVAPHPEELARLHNAFERIHPFIDGNGRTGRLALNLTLVRLGYPPVIIFKRQRDAYLWSLQRSDSGDHGPLGEIIARAMLDNLTRFIFPNVAGPARLVPLAALADKEMTVHALRRAAQRGRLDAQLAGDGIWRSSRIAVDMYKRDKHTRRPGPAQPGVEADGRNNGLS